MHPQHAERLARAHLSLAGLSVGDAFGERYFGHTAYIHQRRLADPPWPFTDDTLMACSIVDNLRQHGAIAQDALAISFADHLDPSRHYGMGARRLLEAIRQGASWRDAAPRLFGGQGSFGNGAAMRIAPLGAYFADDDWNVLIDNACRASEVTHAHPEGIAGGMAVAVAAAVAWQCRGSDAPSRAAFIDRILPHIPPGQVRDRTRIARDLATRDPEQAAAVLGSGREVSAQDTVPFVLWCAGEYLDDYQEALWATVSGLGDRDTTCAMVGGIVVLYTGAESIPAEWLARREPLPEWALAEG